MKKRTYASLAPVLLLSLVPQLSLAQVPPGAVRFTDLACHQLDTDLPPLGAHLFLQHLNPLIGGAVEEVDVWEPQQLCTPVRKNDQVIPNDVIDFVRYLDLKCYRVEGTSTLAGLSLVLSHLNPLLSGLPREPARLYNLTQLCVPVNKLQDGVIPQPIPNSVIDFIKNVDIACYQIDDQVYPFYPVRISELNPMFNFPPSDVTMSSNSSNTTALQKALEVSNLNQAGRKSAIALPYRGATTGLPATRSTHWRTSFGRIGRCRRLMREMRANRAPA